MMRARAVFEQVVAVGFVAAGVDDEAGQGGGFVDHLGQARVERAIPEFQRGHDEQ